MSNEAIIIEQASLYWWDKKENFGDLIGPLLVSCITGKEAINTIGSPDYMRPSLASVGSIIQSLNRPGLHLWGSGVIGALTQKQVTHLRNCRPAQIYALRGKLTHQEISEKLRWQAPSIYGDPALLLPFYYKARNLSLDNSRNEICIVPHYSHAKYFLKNLSGVNLINVKQTPKKVIDQISSAKYCISSSLHGIIVAQAYGIPWLWLRIKDAPLLGNTFKFEDFFTTLEANGIHAATIDPDCITNANMQKLSNLCNLPKLAIELDQLQNCFPHHLF